MVWIAQQSFASGEVSPSMFGLVDSPQFKSGCRTLTNALITRTGGARVRYGTETLFASTGNFPAAIFSYFAKGKQYVVQFVSQDDDAGDLNTTNRQVRIIDASTRAFVNVGDNRTHGPFNAFGSDVAFFHHFTASELPNVYAFQDGSRIVFCHENRPPIFLERSSGGAGVEQWQYGLVGGTALPQIVNYEIDVSITEITSSTIESSSPLFVPADVGGYWKIGGADKTDPDVNIYGAWVQATQFLSRTEVQSARKYGTPGLSISDWSGPYVPTSQTGFTATLVGTSTVENTTSSFTGTGASMRSNDRGTPILVGGTTLWLITGVSSTSEFSAVRLGSEGGPQTGAINIKFLSVGYDINTGLPNRPWFKRQPIFFTDKVGTVNLHNVEPVFSTGAGVDKPWLPEGHENLFDRRGGTSIGGTVFGNRGAVALTSLSTGGVGGNEPIYLGTVTQQLAHRSPTLQWSLGWSEGVGFPRCGASHQGRTVFGGFKESPGRVVASKTFSRDDFTAGALDDEGFSFEIADTGGGRISWMLSTVDLLVGTDTGEFAIAGAPLTSSEVGINPQSGYGGVAVRPALVGNAAFFVSAGGKGIREMAFLFERDRYASPDLTDIASHLFEDTVIQSIAYVSAPDQIIYAIDTAGRMIALSYRRDTGVIAWSPFTQAFMPTNSGADEEAGTIESICSVRADGTNLTSDELWIVRRFKTGGQSSSGTVAFFLERMTPAFTMDSSFTSLTATSTTMTATSVNDLFLAKHKPQVKIDGVYIGNFVSSIIGTITYPDLGFTPTTAEAGREIRMSLVPLRPELVDRATGATQGRIGKVSAVSVALRESRGGTVDGRKIGPPGLSIPDRVTVTKQIPEITGWRRVVGIGEHGADLEVEIAHTEPYYFEVVGLSMELDYGK